MNTPKALLPLVVLAAACAPGDNASSQAVPANVGRVWYYPFERQRIMGLLEEEIDRYGCPFEIAREAFDRATAPARSDAQSYDSTDVRAKIVFASETVFIDYRGVARGVGGREFLIDKKLFVDALVETGPCPELR